MSQRFTLNKDDLKKWAKNSLIFLGPALIVLIGSIIKAVPSDWKYSVIVLYVLNVLLDLFKKWLAGN